MSRCKADYYLLAFLLLNVLKQLRHWKPNILDSFVANYFPCKWDTDESKQEKQLMEVLSIWLLPTLTDGLRFLV